MDLVKCSEIFPETEHYINQYMIHVIGLLVHVDLLVEDLPVGRSTPAFIELRWAIHTEYM